MTTDTLALDFKSATLYAVRVVLHSADLSLLTAALDRRMADAGSFFENEPVVIDASRVDSPIDWPALLQALRGHNLPPIGVVAQGANLRAAQEAGLAAVELSTPRPAPAVETAAPSDIATPVPAVPAAARETATAASADPANEAAAAPGAAAQPPLQESAAPAPASALVITKPLRSGQRVYARHTDLVVIGMVSQGAEVIADGNVHVY